LPWERARCYLVERRDGVLGSEELLEGIPVPVEEGDLVAQRFKHLTDFSREPRRRKWVHDNFLSWWRASSPIVI